MIGGKKMPHNDPHIKDIEFGMVFDHLQLGKSGPIAKHIRSRLWKPPKILYPISAGQGYESTRMERKDMLKLEGYHFEIGDQFLTDLALIYPGASIVWIRDREVVKKRIARLVIPSEFYSDLIDCANGINSNCISIDEAPGRYRMLDVDRLRVRCHYCDVVFDANYNGK